MRPRDYWRGQRNITAGAEADTLNKYSQDTGYMRRAAISTLRLYRPTQLINIDDEVICAH